MKTGDLGRFGEAWTVGHLSRQGYRIVDRNVRYRCGEIDLVAWHNDVLVFVEVKCRRSSNFGTPEEAITRARYHRLEKAILTYLRERFSEEVAYRIDVVAIEVGPAGQVSRYAVIENAELPAVTHS